MKKRMLSLSGSLLMIALLVAIAATTGSKSVSSSSTGTEKRLADIPTRDKETRQAKGKAIDGSTNPEKIPDYVAYSLLFRLISLNETDRAEQRIRAYIKHMGLDQKGCVKKSIDGQAYPDMEALIAAAEEFRQRVSVLDAQATAIMMRYHPEHLTQPTPAEQRELKALRKQKERIVAEIVAGLEKRLSSDGLAKLRRHISERVKQNVKMFVTAGAS